MANAQIIRGMYDAFARGDAASVLGALDLMTEWTNYQVHIEQIVDGGETVVARGRYRGTFNATGQPLDAQFVHVWSLRNGKVTTFQQYGETLQFARVMGMLAVHH